MFFVDYRTSAELSLTTSPEFFCNCGHTLSDTPLSRERERGRERGQALRRRKALRQRESETKRKHPPEQCSKTLLSHAYPY